MTLLLALLLCQAPAERLARVDRGVLQWADDGSEVALFGVNYYPPFSIDYQGLKTLGLDHRKVIDQDLIHLRRLGLDAIRLHCWDREISDREGNLLDNEHLALLDYLIAQAARRGIYTMLTPIAWWGAPAESPGFSTSFTMHQMTTDAAARAAQQRYLAQFVQHRNRETGLTYAEDPAVVAIELINEPIYPQGTTDEQVVEYIDALAGAVRRTGCRKPLFYSYFTGRLAAIGRSSVDGITFGWYPTGLVNGAMLTNNALPLVDSYPALHSDQVARKAKAFYEFDAADVGGSYLYPAMARTFRSGGAQFACQFQYDAWPLAATNANWRTHFLSLPYAPGKAISFMIAAEAFRRLPRGQQYGRSPESDRFSEFRVSYQDDLSELVTRDLFIHSNDTATTPPAAEQLTRLCGVGGNPLVRYDGTGAWFLDRIAPGAWRLEVHPDAVWVDDPFGPTSLSRETARVIWAERTMAIELPDLGQGFTITPLDPANPCRPTPLRNRFALRPGVYRLTRPGAAEPPMSAEFFAPPPAELPARVWHRPADVLIGGRDEPVVVTNTEDSEGTLWFEQDGAWQQRPLRRTSAYRFGGLLPAAALTGDQVRYGLTINQAGQTLSFPGGLPGTPADPRGSPRPLFDAATTVATPAMSLSKAPGQTAAAAIVEGALRITASGFPEDVPASGGLRLPASPAGLPGPTALRITARAIEPATNAVEVGFLQDDGAAYGYDLPLGLGWQTTDLPLDSLKPLWSTRTGRLDPTRLKEISFVIGTWLFRGAAGQPHGLEIRRIELVPREPVWTVAVEPIGPPVPLLRPAALLRQGTRKAGGRVAPAIGPAGQPAVELQHVGFGPPPDSMSVALAVERGHAGRLKAMAACDTLAITCRATTPASTQLEVTLTEEDGAVWGTNLPLGPGWATIEVPLTALKPFLHHRQVPGRGGAGDQFRPAALGRLGLTFGTWLNPAQEGRPWGLQVASVSLVRKAPEGIQ